MNINNTLTLLLFGTFIMFSCHSTKEIYEEDYSSNDSLFTTEIPIEIPEIITYKNATFNSKIKTVLCHKKEEELSLPILNLKADEQLLVSFDDLDADIKDYYYTIIHCNADWTASNLMPSEYINGFTDELIDDYEFSFNTIQQYTHYQFEFPTIDIKPILSGNYVFKIFEEGGETIAYKRFMVLETKINIEANVRRATLAEDRNTKHEIDFTIKHSNLVVADPFADIKVHIKQNNREDNAITNLTPLFVKNDELIYDYDDDNTFWANNEFRHFDFKSLRYQSERIKNIDFDSTHNHVYLFNDITRPFDRYSIEPDINGKFLIKSQEGWKTAIEADYAFVHFTLPVDNISYGDIYVIGAFSDWELKEDFKLNFNADKKQYEGIIYLKQGYYNYHYALNDTTTKRVDVSFIEGTHYQTRNDYYIYVYYRAVGDRYDRFVGFLKTSSKELF
jgi:hypothetical protein